MEVVFFVMHFFGHSRFTQPPISVEFPGSPSGWYLADEAEALTTPGRSRWVTCAAHTTDFGCLLGLERPFTVWDSGETVSYVPGVFSTHDGQPHAYILSNGSGDWEDGDKGGSPSSQSPEPFERM